MGDGLGFICVTDPNTIRQSTALMFLMHVRDLFVKEFGARGAATKLPLDMNAEFAPILKLEMERYSADDGASKLEKLRKEMQKVQDSMQDNIGKALDRGEAMDALADKTDSLNTQA